MRKDNISNKIATIFSIFKIYKWSALFLLFLMLSSSFFESLGLGMILPILELITNPENTDATSVRLLNPILKYFSEYYKFLVVSVIMIIFIVLKNILIILKSGFSVHFTYRYRKLWANEIMNKYIRSDYSYLISQKQGTLINNLIIETESSAQLMKSLIEFISKIVLCLFLYGLMLMSSLKITLFITLIALLIFFILRNITFRYSLNVGKKRVALSQQITTSAAENISGVRQIKTFSVEEQKLQLFSKLLKEFLSILLKFRILHSLPKPFAESIVVTGIVGGLVYLKYLTQIPIVQMLPLIALFVVISQRLFPNASQLFSDRMTILNLVPSLKLTNDLYQKTIEQEDIEKGIEIKHLKENIIFDNVQFDYNKSVKLFEGINLAIPKGKITAIIGSSGEGKSTIVDLLFGLFKPKKGKIIINDKDLQDLKLKSWRQLTGYVSQDVFLFNSTIRENILIGKPDATEQEIRAAAIQANADDFIKILPEGYDTIIGDRGLKLSGGQRQRIAIARVLVRDPELIIFDEATSAVDSETEQMIQKCIIDLSKTKTIIIISHRESTIQNADIVYTLENGVITQYNDNNSKSLVS